MPLLFAILFSPLFRHYYLIFAFIDFIDAADAIIAFAMPAIYY
jgi:hypothetical protein